MSSIDLSAYKELYIKTAQGYLEAMQASLMLLRVDVLNKSAVETLYRSGHSLKSQSALMGYKNTASLSHYIEAVFRNIIEGKETINEKTLSEVKEAIDKIRESLESIESLDKEISLSETITN